MSLAFYSPLPVAEWWYQALKQKVLALDFQVWPNIDRPDRVNALLTWAPPSEMISALPNLQAIFSLGAGVDHLWSHQPVIADHIAITRVVDRDLTQRMAEYICAFSLQHRLQLSTYAMAQQEKQWVNRNRPNTEETRVAILGYGVIGHHTGELLSQLGFSVSGWGNTPKPGLSVAYCFGKEALHKMLVDKDIVICLLPLTAETEGILNATLFATMKPGTLLINVSRGQHLVDDDLLMALDQGIVARAILDVFRQEPLPADSPLWSHPNITITPHIAGGVSPEVVVSQIAENYLRLQEGKSLLNCINRDKGY